MVELTGGWRCAAYQPPLLFRRCCPPECSTKPTVPWGEKGGEGNGMEAQEKSSENEMAEIQRDTGRARVEARERETDDRLERYL